MNASNKKGIILSNLLQKKLIDLDLISKTKKEVMKELVDLVSVSGVVEDRKTFLKALLKRETLGTTGIGNGVAIPHAKEDSIKDFAIAFGRSKEGIDFGALDGKKTHIFFVVAMPPQETEAQLKILAKIARLIKDIYAIKCLLKANTEKEIIVALKRVELNLI